MSTNRISASLDKGTSHLSLMACLPHFDGYSCTATSVLTTFSAQAMIERQPKHFNKPQLSRIHLSIPAAPVKKTTCGQTFQKQIDIFKYSASTPLHFLNSISSYEMSGLLPSMAMSDNEETIRDEITQRWTIY